MHFFKDVYYVGNNIVLNFVSQVLDVNPEGLFWTITNGKYWIIGKHELNNFQDIVLTLGIVVSMANIVVEGVMMKEGPNVVSHNSKFSVSIMKSLFIDLCDSSIEDNPSLPDVVVPISMNSQLVEKQPLQLDVPQAVTFTSIVDLLRVKCL